MRRPSFFTIYGPEAIHALLSSLVDRLVRVSEFCLLDKFVAFITKPIIVFVQLMNSRPVSLHMAPHLLECHA